MSEPSDISGVLGTGTTQLNSSALPEYRMRTMAVISLPSWRNTICSPAWLIGVVWQKNPPQACSGLDAVVSVEANSMVAVATATRIIVISLSNSWEYIPKIADMQALNCVKFENKRRTFVCPTVEAHSLGQVIFRSGSGSWAQWVLLLHLGQWILLLHK